jgi:hypothetical protein
MPVVDARAHEPADAPPAASRRTAIRVGAAQPKSRLIDWHIRDRADVLRQLDKSLAELGVLVEKAGALGCDALALPEDTLGLGALGGGEPAVSW